MTHLVAVPGSKLSEVLLILVTKLSFLKEKTFAVNFSDSLGVEEESSEISFAENNLTRSFYLKLFFAESLLRKFEMQF